MADPLQALCALVGACTVAAAVGGSFIFGVATVCRWMKWAPINTTINIETTLPRSPQETAND